MGAGSAARVAAAESEPAEPPPQTTGGRPKCVCVVVEHRGRVLLLKRTTPPLIWWVPSGYLDKGEEWVACARRELREETGIEADLAFIGVFNLVEEAHTVVIAYATAVDDPGVVINEESSAFRWARWGQALQEVSPARRELLLAAKRESACLSS